MKDLHQQIAKLIFQDHGSNSSNYLRRLYPQLPEWATARQDYFLILEHLKKLEREVIDG